MGADWVGSAVIETKADGQKTPKKADVGTRRRTRYGSRMIDGIENLRQALASANDELEHATRALAPKHVGGEMEAYAAAHSKLMSAERALAEAEGRPFATLCDCSLTWDIGAPLPTLLQSDEKAFLFFLLPGADEQVGKVQFEGLSATYFGLPNDETFEGHSLYGSGFEPYRAMRVFNSPWLQQLEKMNSVHRRHDPSRFTSKQHYIFPFHDTTFECVARSFSASVVTQRLSAAVREAISALY